MEVLTLKIMKAIENKKKLRDQKIEELTKTLALENEKLAHARIYVSSKKEKDFNKINQSKKQTARILTIMREKLEAEND